jgi:BioD-like phosphotransacetylase family protein
MTTCIYIVQSQKNGTVRERYHLVGVYSNKQLADDAGKDHCDELNEFYEEQQNYSVTILPLDGTIDELNN